MPYCTENNFEVAPGVYTHDYTKEEVETAEGCCQKFVCGIPCPKQFDRSGVALVFGLPVVLVSLAWIVMGLVVAWLTMKRYDYKSFFVCNRSLPLYIVALALSAQGLDIATTLGSALNTYKFSFWDGAVGPLGVGLSLILNGVFLAAPINRMGLLTLPDLFHRKYGIMMEVMVSFIEIASFTVLLAGNLVGISLVLQFCFGLPKGMGIIIAGIYLALYTASGGLYSVALTDIPQVLGGLTGLLVTAIYMLVTEEGGLAAPPSKGFAVELGTNVTASTPGYSGPASCVDPLTGSRTCDNFAYPSGDHIIMPGGMTDPDAYAPYPNSLVYNWCIMFVLGFGNLCALDFQARCIAAKGPDVARAACLIAGAVLLVIGLPFLALGGLARKYFGPDSPYAEFEVDTCSAASGMPSCAQWVPQEHEALLAMLWEQAPRAIGAWALVALMAAAVSTADGAILATATVTAHNLWRKVPRFGANERNLLLVSRIFILPMTGAACLVALLAYRTSYLLVLSFDIVVAGVLVPLVAAVYADVSPNAGILSCISGCLLRITLEQLVPKDGSLVAPLGSYNRAYGRAVPGLPAFIQVDPPELTEAAGVWNPDSLTCSQARLADWSGLDSLLSPVFGLMVMVTVTLVERRWPGVDVLWFVPKTWRQASPLYVDDASGHSGIAKLAADPRPLDSRRFRSHSIMPPVPEEDFLDLYGSSGGEVGAATAAVTAGGGPAAAGRISIAGRVSAAGRASAGGGRSSNTVTFAAAAAAATAASARRSSRAAQQSDDTEYDDETEDDDDEEDEDDDDEEEEDEDEAEEPNIRRSHMTLDMTCCSTLSSSYRNIPSLNSTGLGTTIREGQPDAAAGMESRHREDGPPDSSGEAPEAKRSPGAASAGGLRGDMTAGAVEVWGRAEKRRTRQALGRLFDSAAGGRVEGDDEAATGAKVRALRLGPAGAWDGAGAVGRAAGSEGWVGEEAFEGSGTHGLDGMAPLYGSGPRLLAGAGAGLGRERVVSEQGGILPLAAAGSERGPIAMRHPPSDAVQEAAAAAGPAAEDRSLSLRIPVMATAMATTAAAAAARSGPKLVRQPGSAHGTPP